VPVERRQGIDLWHRYLETSEKDGRVTEAHRTVIDCAKDLPRPEALVIADSALRHRDVDRIRLLRKAEALPTNGRTQALRVVREATRTRKAFRRDCQRYTGLVIRGWIVVRFAWKTSCSSPTTSATRSGTSWPDPPNGQLSRPACSGPSEVPELPVAGVLG
jgi:hypothetical protein